jgi:hypothetical protein
VEIFDVTRETKGVEEKYSLKHILKTTSEVLGVQLILFQIVLEKKLKMLQQD